MTVDDIQKRVREIISNAADIDISAITEDASFVDDLGIDSLTATEIIFDVEQGFGIVCTEDEARLMKCMRDICAVIEMRISEVKSQVS